MLAIPITINWTYSREITYNSNDFEIKESQFRSKGNILGLVPSIHDHVNLDFPLNQICREGCAGICIDCGLDLNQQSCVYEQTFLS